MRLTIVGCSGSVPGPDSPSSCYLVEHDGFKVLLDLGHGAFGALQKYVDPSLIDAVLLSHLHADHWVDLSALQVWRHHGPGHATRPFVVLAPGDGQIEEAVAWAPHQQVGPFTVTTTRVAHPVEAYAMRLEAGGRSLTYSGDTGPCDALLRIAEGSDLLLAEAAYVDGRDNPKDLHLTGRDAGEAATAANVGHLVITHVPPWESWGKAKADAAAAYAGPLDLAFPGLTLEV
jgi:ribonuclease BN (tRNA processing enzyme)